MISTCCARNCTAVLCKHLQILKHMLDIEARMPRSSFIGLLLVMAAASSSTLISTDSDCHDIIIAVYSSSSLLTGRPQTSVCLQPAVKYLQRLAHVICSL